MSWDCYCTPAIAVGLSLDRCSDATSRRNEETECPHCDRERENAISLKAAKALLLEQREPAPIKYVTGEDMCADEDHRQCCPLCRSAAIIFEGLPGYSENACTFPMRCIGCQYRFALVLISVAEEDLGDSHIVYRWFERGSY